VPEQVPKTVLLENAGTMVMNPLIKQMLIGSSMWFNVIQYAFKMASRWIDEMTYFFIAMCLRLDHLHSTIKFPEHDGAAHHKSTSISKASKQWLIAGDEPAGNTFILLFVIPIL
jgi:hypothetical protein